MGHFGAWSKRSSCNTGSDVVGGSGDDRVMMEERAKKSIAPTRAESLEFPYITLLIRKVCSRNGRNLSE